MKSVDYQEYMASREWALLRVRVKARAHGVCERCGRAPVTQTHHLTYARLGHEWLKDLQGVCAGCHEWLSGVSQVDPAAGLGRRWGAQELVYGMACVAMVGFVWIEVMGLASK